MRRSELPHEQKKANLAEPLALNSWLHCTGKKIHRFRQKRSFQQYPPFVPKSAWKKSGTLASGCIEP